MVFGLALGQLCSKQRRSQRFNSFCAQIRIIQLSDGRIARIKIETVSGPSSSQAATDEINKQWGLNMSKYNGWTNYATWRVNLEIFDGGNWDRYSAQDLKEFVQDHLESTSSGLALDYALAFIDDVNWHEIAKSLRDDEEEAA